MAYRQPSHGTFSINARVSYLFGFPESVSFPGVVMDIDKLTFSTEAKDNCWSKWTDFNKASGSRSSLLENQVPEMLFTDPDAPAVQKPQGISATKAIAIAMGQG